MPIFLNVQAYRGTAPVPPIGRRFGREGGVVGRGAGSDLVLDDPTKYISRAHARVEFRDGGWLLVDIGTNASLVNGQPVGPARPARLTGGERIDIGDYALLATVEQEQEQTQELEPEPEHERNPALPVAGHAQLAIAAAPAVPLPREHAIDPLAAASIVNLNGSFDEAFDPGFDPLGLNLAVPAVPSRGGAYRGTESDHAPPEQAAFAMPRAAAAPGPAIPHDYDPMADLLAAPAPAALQPPGAPPAVMRPASPPAPATLPETAAASPPLPAVQPVVQPVLPPVMERVPEPMPQPMPQPVRQAHMAPESRSAPPAPRPGTRPDAEPAMRTVLQPPLRPASSPATAAAPPAVAPPGDDSRILQALLRGLGLPELQSRRSAEELAELAGAMLREATAGTIGVLMARTLTKRESRVEMTMIAPQANNPLKFFPDAATALTHMLQGTLPGYLPPERAFAGAFVDLRAHELAVMAGTRAALAGVLRRFDPAAIEERLHEPGLLEKMFSASRKTRMWDQLVELYGQLAVEADEDFQRLFGEAFASAYEEQVRRLRDAGQ